MVRPHLAVVPLKVALRYLWDQRGEDVTPGGMAAALSGNTNRAPGLEAIDRLVQAGYAELVTRKGATTKGFWAQVQLTTLGDKRCRELGMDA